MSLYENYEHKIKEIYSELRKSEKKVADYILANKIKRDSGKQ